MVPLLHSTHYICMNKILLLLDQPINIISVHDQANVLSGLKYLMEATVVHINHHHLQSDITNDITLHQYKVVQDDILYNTHLIFIYSSLNRDFTEQCIDLSMLGYCYLHLYGNYNKTWSNCNYGQCYYLNI